MPPPQQVTGTEDSSWAHKSPRKTGSHTTPGSRRIAKRFEFGRAFVVSKPGCVLDEHGIIAHCRRNLAGYKVPGEVRFVDELPHNATGKILKHELPRD